MSTPWAPGGMYICGMSSLLEAQLELDLNPKFLIVSI